MPDNNTTQLAIANAEQSLPAIFNNPVEKKNFLRTLTEVYLNNKALLQLDPQRVNACALQLFLKGADMSSGEGFIIGYKKKATGETIASTQTGYKFAMKKLYETGELLEWPTINVIKEGEVVEFNPHNNDATITKPSMKSGVEYQAWSKKNTVGFLIRFVMSDGVVIEKFYWKETIVEHVEKYSDAYKRWVRNGKKNDGSIWATQYEPMLMKTAFMRAYTKYLPKTSKTQSAINDINALNAASYSEMAITAKPEYVDNPQNKENKNLGFKPKVKMFGLLGASEKWLAWKTDVIVALPAEPKGEGTRQINKTIQTLSRLDSFKTSKKDAGSVADLSADDYLNVLVPTLKKYHTLVSLNDFNESGVVLLDGAVREV